MKLVLSSFTRKYEAKAAELKSKYGDDFDQPVVTYSLNKAEQGAVNEWYQSLLPEILAIQKKHQKNSGDNFVMEDEPYYGAIGGGLTYSFIGTSLGTIITVKESTTGKELNVNEALDWHFFG